MAKTNINYSNSWLFKMAWRDGKASFGKLMLFMAAIVLGIAAVVSIQSFGENLKQNIALQSKSLMGADYIIDSKQPPNKKVSGIIDSLGGGNGKEITFASMAAFPKSGDAKLIQLRGIAGEFPFYGELGTSPKKAAKEYQSGQGALVDATLMLQFGLNPGDSIKIGDIKIPIQGSLNSVPGSSSLFSSIAPPVLIPYNLIAKTGLIQTGSRITYKYYFVAPQGLDIEKFGETLDPVLDNEDADLDTHLSTSERLGRRYQNFAKFLNLVAFIALLLGCVGISSSIHIYIKEKIRSIAVLKCLGATKAQSFLIFLIQIAGMGLVGGLLGTAGGLLLQQLFPLLLQGLLPLDIQISIVPQAIIMGVLLGVVMSVIFALYPLIGTLYISPLQALRIQHKTSAKSSKARTLVLLAIFIFILIFAFWLLKDWKYTLIFVVGIMIVFSILAGIAGLFMKTIKKFFPANWGFIARQSLLNLFRPHNQTLILIISIGIGTFLISTLYFTKDMLLAQASLESSKNSPNLILLDVQTKQRDELSKVITTMDLPVLADIPIVTMKVAAINEQSADYLRKDSTSQVKRWILNHEFRVTYRDSLIDSEKIEQGEWIGSSKDSQTIPISVSSNFANDANVQLNDSINFNVQGVPFTTRIVSIRSVDWSRPQPNFTVVFPSGVLEKAPQFRVFTTRTEDTEVSAKLQREVVQKFPNISVIDIRQVLEFIEEILGKIAWLINFMALFSILTGIIVLIGAVRTSKYQRIKESVLLRTLGAQSNQILKIYALEYLYLGILGSLSGILLSLIGSQLLAYFLFETAFVPSLVPFLILFPGICLLVLLIGISNSISVIKKPPLAVLRKEIA